MHKVFYRRLVSFCMHMLFYLYISHTFSTTHKVNKQFNKRYKKIFSKNTNEKYQKTISSFYRLVFEYLFKKANLYSIKQNIIFNIQDDK